MEKGFVCSVCGKHTIGYGNCSEPVKRGMCCEKCKKEIVIPRVTAFLNAVFELDNVIDCE